MFQCPVWFDDQSRIMLLFLICASEGEITNGVAVGSVKMGDQPAPDV